MDLLSYPLDVNYILRKKKSIKRKLLENPELINKKIAILGGSTTEEFKNILEIFLLNNNIIPDFYESDYNQFYEESVFHSEKLDEFEPDIIYIFTSVVNISKFPDYLDNEIEINDIYIEQCNVFEEIWNALEKYNCPIIQNNFDFLLNRSLGNLDAYDNHGKTFFINKLNYFFSCSANKKSNLFLCDINYLSSYIGLNKWFDKSLWYQAKYAISFEAIPELALNVSKIILSIFGSGKKCLILDLDNTCWGGIIGDDGISGIDIGYDSAIAESFTELQKYSKELMQRGITLAVCSKNNLQNAKEGFLHPDTTLKYEDFTSFKANWSPKHENVFAISDEINIGLDSLVFVDDNPSERNIVSNFLPTVTVPNVGNDVINFVNYIDRNAYFEPTTLQIDDVNRSKYYQDNKKRSVSSKKFKSYDEFLKSLEMTAEINFFSENYFQRITQLINKTNQFNLTTKRLNISEVESFANDKNYITLYSKLTDKFGCNGLVSVLIGKIDEDILHIDMFLMSCRVLKRELENTIMNELVKLCKLNKIEKIIGYYFKTKKNDMVSSLYGELGFKKIESNENESIWSLNTSDFKNNKTLIEVRNA